jgi:phosphate-selective porin OprO and OprP
MKRTYILLPATVFALGAASAHAQPQPPPPASPPAPPQPDGKVEAAANEEPPLAGWHGVFFLRDPNDWFIFYPRGRMHWDITAFAGPGVSDLKAPDGGTALSTRLFARRLRFELAGTFFKRFDFLMGVDFGGQPLSNANGKTETAAGPAGSDPTADTARFAPVQAVSSQAVLANAWINARIIPEFQLMLGQEKAPFSLENRTSNNTHTWMERSLPIRSFAFPSGKEIGLTAWGDVLDPPVLSYEVGWFLGDGQNRGQVDDRFDWLGRVFTRPFNGQKGFFDKWQIGLSAKHGERDPDEVGYDYAAVSTGHGFQLWSPTYRDSLKRVVHVLPSGAQNEIGGELRLTFGPVALQGEAYYVANHTREAIDGFQLTNTERLGSITGVGWYAQLSGWPFGDAFIDGDPGLTRPTKVKFDKPFEVQYGLELFGIVGGVNASYDGASREGAYDSKTPGADGVGTDIVTYEYGLGASFWYTKFLKLSFNYIIYHTPGSGSSDNLAAVPGNIVKEPDPDAHLLHEIGTRAHLSF